MFNAISIELSNYMYVKKIKSPRDINIYSPYYTACEEGVEEVLHCSDLDILECITKL